MDPDASNKTAHLVLKINAMIQFQFKMFFKTFIYNYAYLSKGVQRANQMFAEKLKMVVV